MAGELAKLREQALASRSSAQAPSSAVEDGQFVIDFAEGEGDEERGEGDDSAAFASRTELVPASSSSRPPARRPPPCGGPQQPSHCGRSQRHPPRSDSIEPATQSQQSQRPSPSAGSNPQHQPSSHAHDIPRQQRHEKHAPSSSRTKQQQNPPTAAHQRLEHPARGSLPSDPEPSRLLHAPSPAPTEHTDPRAAADTGITGLERFAAPHTAELGSRRRALIEQIEGTKLRRRIVEQHLEECDLELDSAFRQLDSIDAGLEQGQYSSFAPSHSGKETLGPRHEDAVGKRKSLQQAAEASSERQRLPGPAQLGQRNEVYDPGGSKRQRNDERNGAGIEARRTQIPRSRQGDAEPMEILSDDSEDQGRRDNEEVRTQERQREQEHQQPRNLESLQQQRTERQKAAHDQTQDTNDYLTYREAQSRSARYDNKRAAATLVDQAREGQTAQRDNRGRRVSEFVANPQISYHSQHHQDYQVQTADGAKKKKQKKKMNESTAKGKHQQGSHQEVTKQPPQPRSKKPPNTPPGAKQRADPKLRLQRYDYPHQQPQQQQHHHYSQQQQQQEDQEDEEEEEGQLIENEPHGGASPTLAERKQFPICVWEVLGFNDEGLLLPQSSHTSEHEQCSATDVRALLGRNVHVWTESTHIPLCPYDLRGRCNDHECKLQHMRTLSTRRNSVMAMNEADARLPLYNSPTLSQDDFCFHSEPLIHGNPAFATPRRFSAARASEKGRYHEEKIMDTDAQADTVARGLEQEERFSISAILHAALDKADFLSKTDNLNDISEAIKILKKALEHYHDQRTLWIHYLSFLDVLSRRGAFNSDPAGIADTAVSYIQGNAADVYAVILRGLIFRTSVDSMIMALMQGMEHVAPLIDDAHGSAHYADLAIRLVGVLCDSRRKEDVVAFCSELTQDPASCEKDDECRAANAAVPLEGARRAAFEVRKISQSIKGTALAARHMALIRVVAAAALANGSVPAVVHARLGYVQEVPVIEIHNGWKNSGRNMVSTIEQLLLGACQCCPNDDFKSYTGALTSLSSFAFTSFTTRDACASVRPMLESLSDEVKSRIAFCMPLDRLQQMLSGNSGIGSVGASVLAWRSLRDELCKAHKLGNEHGKDSPPPSARSVVGIARRGLKYLNVNATLDQLPAGLKAPLRSMLEALSDCDSYSDFATNAVHNFEHNAMGVNSSLGYENAIRREAFQYLAAQAASGKQSIEHCLERTERLLSGSELEPLIRFKEVEDDSRLLTATHDAMCHQGIQQSSPPLRADVLEDLFGFKLPRNSQKLFQTAVMERVVDTNPSADLAKPALTLDGGTRGVAIAMHVLGMSRGRGGCCAAWRAVSSHLSSQRVRAELWRVATSFEPWSAEAWRALRVLIKRCSIALLWCIGACSMV